MKDFNAFLDMEDIRIRLIKWAPENIYLKTYSINFPRAQSASFPTLKALQGFLKVNSYSSTGFNLPSGMLQNALGK